MTRRQLLDLAERVEREEPSAALSIAVIKACGWERPNGAKDNIWHHDIYGFRSGGPDPLHSLDAAVTLERKDLWVFVNKYQGSVSVFATDNQGTAVADSRAPDEPRARTAAALRARALEARDE